MSVTLLVTADAAERLPSFGGEIWPVPVRNWIHRISYEQFVLPWLARRFDVLFCFSDLAPWIKTTPTVAMLCNLNIYDRRFYDNRRLQMLEWGVRVGLRGIRTIVFPTAAAADSIGELLGIDQISTHVIHHGIDADDFGMRARSAPATSEGKDRHLLVPAAVERHKNIEIVIRALAITGDRHLELHVVGTRETDPGYASELEHLADEVGVASRIRFLGPVSYDRIPGLYRDAAAVCLPSWIETFGLPVLESMVVGRPILVSDRPVFHEIAGDAGWYFDPSRPESLARMIDRIQPGSKECEERIEIGRQRSREFSWRASADRLCEVLAEAAEGSTKV
jgi:glycosyltransferase involved in cell wall biosynthesis